MARARAKLNRRGMYDRDFNLWVEEQLALSEARAFERLDLANRVDEKPLPPGPVLVPQGPVLVPRPVSVVLGLDPRTQSGRMIPNGRYIWFLACRDGSAWA
jgi:hypothetical protein